MIVVCAVAAPTIISNTGCTPATEAKAMQVENLVRSDLAAGKTLQQTELDVARLLTGQPGVDVALVLDDALALLVSLGLIPSALAEDKVIAQKAATMRGELRRNSSLHRWALQPTTYRPTDKGARMG